MNCTSPRRAHVDDGKVTKIAPHPEFNLLKAGN
jgi:hypothetical protein